MKSKTVIGMLVLAIVIVASVIVGFQYGGVKLSTVLAVSTIKIDPLRPGQIQSDGAYVGGYWVVLADTATAYGTHVFYQFNSSQVNQYSEGNTTNVDPVTGQKLFPQASIQLSVDVGQPYLKSDLYEYDNMLVLPATYGSSYSPFTGTDTYLKEYKTYDNGVWNKHNDGPILAQSVTYWRTQNNWQVVIPLDISATKIKADGTSIPLNGPSGTPSYHVEPTFSGSANLQPITFINPSDSSETITFTKVGLLSAGAWPSANSMFILRNDLIWKDDGNVEPYVKYSSSTVDRRAFVNDWFGESWGVPNWKTHTDGSIYVDYNVYAAQWDQGSGYAGIGSSESYPFQTFKYPNKVTYDQLMYSGTPYTVASGRPNSLAAWLDYSKGQHLKPNEVNPYTGLYQVDTDNKVIKLFLNQNEFLWLYTVDISTDVADTYVWQPSYQTGVITDAHWQSGETIPHIPIAGSNTILVTVSNTGDAPGGFILKFATNPANAPTVIPDTPTGAITPGQPKQVTVQVINFGGTQDVSTSITISLFNDNYEDQHSSVTVQCVFSAGGGENTYLTVLTNDGDLPVSGIQVTIKYSTASQSEPTTYGLKTFNLGMYTGPVTISTPEDSIYQSTAGSTTVHSGLQSYTVKLVQLGQTQDWTWLILVVVITVAIAVVAVIMTKGKRKRR